MDGATVGNEDGDNDGAAVGANDGCDGKNVGAVVGEYVISHSTVSCMLLVISGLNSVSN